MQHTSPSRSDAMDLPPLNDKGLGDKVIPLPLPEPVLTPVEGHPGFFTDAKGYLIYIPSKR